MAGAACQTTSHGGRQPRHPWATCKLIDEYASAINLLTETLDKEPPADLSDKIRLRLATCHATCGDFKSALIQAKNAVQADPNLAEAHFVVGAIYMDLGQWKLAEAKIREALATTLITDDTLGAMFAEDLRVLRNEVYARHGRVFKDVKLQKYFEEQSWYKANPDFKDDQLSEIESANLKKIKEAEDSATSKFTAAEG